MNRNYEVSDHGNIRRRTAGINARPGIIRKLNYDGYGYPQIGIHVNGKQRALKVHRLVMEAFVGPMPKGMTVNHKDGNKTNNCLENLEYCTVSENQAHAGKMGLKAWGERNCKTKLSESQVHLVRALRKEGHTCPSLAKQFGVNTSTIKRIVYGVTWRHLAQLDAPRPTPVHRMEVWESIQAERAAKDAAAGSGVAP